MIMALGQTFYKLSPCKWSCCKNIIDIIMWQLQGNWSIEITLCTFRTLRHAPDAENRIALRYPGNHWWHGMVLYLCGSEAMYLCSSICVSGSQWGTFQEALKIFAHAWLMMTTPSYLPHWKGCTVARLYRVYTYNKMRRVQVSSNALVCWSSQLYLNVLQIPPT